MKFATTILPGLMLLAGSVSAQTTPPTVAKTVPVNYTHEGFQLLGHLSVPENGTGPFPAVIIIPDWDGVNEYEQIRATLVTEEWNMVGFAADIYGADKQTVEDFDERVELATLYRSNSTLFAERIQAAVDLIKEHEKVDASQIALFGYCFGGSGVLMYGFEGYGEEDVQAVVSFHGGLSSVAASNATFGPKALVLSGGEDDMASEIMELEMLLDSVSAPWEITRYSGIEHAFTVWDDDRYNEWADLRSWQSAGHFILEAFGIIELTSAQPDEVDVTPVNYTGVDGKELMGYLAMPSAEWQRPLPAVVVFPDWDGVNMYEKERAAALAAEGYVAFAADIYGADMQELVETQDKVEAVTKYRTDPELYVSRMQDAIDQVKALTDDVDSDEIAIIGYCFGGSGVVLYALSNGTDAKVAVPFHGSFQEMPPVQGDINSYILVLSGGDDDAHGNQTTMEEAFDQGQADWEITRYAGILHGYTKWGSDAYDLFADARSWESMMTSFTELLAVPGKVGVNGTVEESDPCAVSRDESLCPPEESSPSAQSANMDSSAYSAFGGVFYIGAVASAFGSLFAL